MALGEMFASSFHLSRPGSAVAVLLGSWGFSGEVLPSALCLELGLPGWNRDAEREKKQGRRPPSPWGSPLPLISGGLQGGAVWSQPCWGQRFTRKLRKGPCAR